MRYAQGMDAVDLREPKITIRIGDGFSMTTSGSTRTKLPGLDIETIYQDGEYEVIIHEKPSSD